MSSLLLKKVFFISVALLASAVPFEQAQAAEPVKFPEGQEAPLPGPVQSGEVTLWQLPEDYRSVIKTEKGEVYGIYYSAWARKDTDTLPGVFGATWITNRDNEYQPWKGNPDLAKELSEKYFGDKKGLMISCTEDNLLGENCVAGGNGEVKNLNLYGFWNGGGFAYGKAIDKDGLDYVLRPSGPKGFGTDPIAYYWNGDLYRTASGAEYKIQFFAGCKLTTIFSDHNSSDLGSVEDCNKGVAPIFQGGTLNANSEALNLDQNFAVIYGESELSETGGTVDNQGLALNFNGQFDSFGQGSKGTLRFTGSGSTTINNQVSLRGDLVVDGGSSLTITTPSASDQQIENASLIPTPLIFEEGDNTVTVESGAVLRVAGDDLSDGVGPRKPGESDLPINGDGNHRSPVISLGDGDDNLNIEAGGLLVASYVGMLPSEYDLHKNNCKEGSDPSTCYRAIPQIDFGNGNDTLTNNGVIAGPSESPTGNFLEIHLRGGNDKVVNNGYLGCLTGGADAGGWNGNRGQNTCNEAASLVGGDLQVSNDLNRNYNVNFQFEGGNDIYENYGYQRGSVNMAGGNDTLKSAGGLRGGITMGAGSDTLQIEANGSWDGSGIVDDWISLGNGRSSDSSNSGDNNELTLVGDAVISFRNSLGFDSDQCGGKSEPGGYGCRWRDNGSKDYGYRYLAVSGSNGSDSIVVQIDSVVAANDVKTVDGAQIWGSVDLGDSSDSLELKTDTHLDLVGDLDLGSGDSQLITVAEDADFSVRAIKGSDVDFSIAGTATLGGDTTLGVFEVDNPEDLKLSNTLSTYKGLTVINQGGTLRDAQQWSFSRFSTHQVDGVLEVNSPQQIGNLTSSESALGNVALLRKDSELRFGLLGGDVDYYGSSSGEGSLIKNGKGTTTIHGTLGHSGKTSVRDGTLRIGSTGVLNPTSSLIANGGDMDNPSTVDLGGTTQDVQKTLLRGGALENGSLSSGNQVIVDKFNSNIIADLDGQSGATVKVGFYETSNPDVRLSFSGDNYFESLAIDRATVEVQNGASLTLESGVKGGDFTSTQEDTVFQDRLDVQGTLTVGDTIDLGGGDDILRIGKDGSVAGTGDFAIAVDGGEGEADIFLDETGNYFALAKGPDGLFVEDTSSEIDTQVLNFEIVGVRGQGVAYFGDKTSFIVDQAEGAPPVGDYGSMMATTTTDQAQTLTINADGTVESLTTVDAIALSSNQASIVVPQGTLQAGLIYGISESAFNSIVLGTNQSLEFRSVLQADGDRRDVDFSQQGRLSVGDLVGFDQIVQKGGIWSYEGNLSTANLVAQGGVQILEGDQAELASISSKQEMQTETIQADDGNDDLTIVAVSGSLTLGSKPQSDALDGAAMTSNVVLSDVEGSPLALLVGAPRTSITTDATTDLSANLELNGTAQYQGATIVGTGGFLNARNGVLSSASKTFVNKGGKILIDGQQDLARLVVRDTGTFVGEEAQLSSRSIVNRGDIKLDSLVMQDGMDRFIDRYIVYRESQGELIDPESPLRKIKAQGSLKNIGGSIEIANQLRFESDDGEGGHVLLNLSDRGQIVDRETRIDVRSFLSGANKQASLTAGSIQFSDQNDVLINTGFLNTTSVVEPGSSDGINFGGGNDLVLNNGEINIVENTKINGGEPLDFSQWDANGIVKGLNIYRDSTLSAGDDISHLENWAAIKYGEGKNQGWIFPQGGDCNISEEEVNIVQNAFCVALTGSPGVDQTLKISNNATFDVGVIPIPASSESNNTIEIQNGNLHVLLIDSLGQDFNVVGDNQIVLGDDNGGSGELIVGAMSGVSRLEQKGGVWTYGINGVSDPERREKIVERGRRTDDQLDQMSIFPDLSGYGVVRIAEVELGLQSSRRVDADAKTIQRAAFSSITGDQEQLLRVRNEKAELIVENGIRGNASLYTSGQTVLNGEGASDYFGETIIDDGGDLRAGDVNALSPNSAVTIKPGGLLSLDGYDNTIRSLNGDVGEDQLGGVVDLSPDCEGESEDSDCFNRRGSYLTIRSGNFSGVIDDSQQGVPDVAKQGLIIVGVEPSDRLTFSGPNSYSSPTFIQSGALRVGADFALSENSSHIVLGGELDVRGYRQVLRNGLDVRGGVLRVESDNPLTVRNEMGFSDGRIVAYLNNGTADDGALAPLDTDRFLYTPGDDKIDANHGIYAVVDPAGASDPDLNGTWKIIDGDVENAQALASKTYLIFPVQPGQEAELDENQIIVVDNQLFYVANFAGLNEPLDAAALKTIVLEEGSLNIVVTDKSLEEIKDDITEVDEGLDGCEGQQELCEGLSDPVVETILEAVIPESSSGGISDQLPVLHWGNVAALLGSGLSPRNVDAAPRGLQTYNNVLADTIFERHPLRQFVPVDVEPEAKSEVSAPDEPLETQPVRGLWNNQPGLNEDQANAYVTDLLQQVSSADTGVPDAHAANHEHLIQVDGVTYQENPSLTAQYAHRDGWRGWYRGFAANNRAYDSTAFANDYSLYTGGFALGADVSLSQSFQLGAYANYGDVTVVQNGSTGGGSWSPDGWGGGLTADYLTDNFYVQGLLGASGFSATQRRGIVPITDRLGDDTASGQKSATSYLGALRIGAPFQVGSLLLEPQLTGTWTQNHESGFSESNVDSMLQLKYRSRTTNYLQTGLGVKLAWPIDAGERAEWVPSLKLAWLADWDLGNQGQSIDYSFGDRSASFSPEQEHQNGALIEVGLDYSIANFNAVSMKVYANGGAELWGGDRGTTWRATGGVTFQF